MSARCMLALSMSDQSDHRCSTGRPCEKKARLQAKRDNCVAKRTEVKSKRKGYVGNQ